MHRGVFLVLFFFLCLAGVCSPHVIMEFNAEKFVTHPTLEEFNSCTKDHLISLASFLEIPVSKQMKKQSIKAEISSVLSKKGLLPSEVTVEGAGSDVSEAVRLKELEIEMRRLDLREKELSNEMEVRKMEEETKRQVRLKELELQQSPPSPSHSSSSGFDIGKCIRFVPSFNDKDVDKYFTLFERVANTLQWPKHVWTLLLQCVFTGKAQDAYASLSSELSLDYEHVKKAVLRAYELVPEAYRQRFRCFKKSDDQTYVEFGHEKEVLFDRWCHSLQVYDFDKLRDLMLVEDFKNCLPERIVTHINDRKALNVSEAAVLADEYVLTHKDRYDRPQPPLGRSFSASRPPVIQKSSGDGGVTSGVKESDRVCSFCKKHGHTVDYCFALNKKTGLLKLSIY